MKKLFLILTLLICSSSYGQLSDSDFYKKYELLAKKYRALEDGDVKTYKQLSVDESPYYETGKAQFDDAESFALRCFELELNQKFEELDADDLYKADEGYFMFNKKGYIAFSQYDAERYSRINDLWEVSFTSDHIFFRNERDNNLDFYILDTDTLIIINPDRPRSYQCVHTNINEINFGKEFLTEVEEIEEQKRYDKIFNACLLDKAKGMSMEVDSVRDAVEGACDKVAKNPSWLDNWKYN